MVARIGLKISRSDWNILPNLVNWRKIEVEIIFNYIDGFDSQIRGVNRKGMLELWGGKLL